MVLQWPACSGYTVYKRVQWREDVRCSRLCMFTTLPFQSVVIIVGVVVCEISTGIFIELEKNDALVSMCACDSPVVSMQHCLGHCLSIDHLWVGTHI